MTVNSFLTSIFIFGFLHCSHAGNQCATRFPGRGYCVSRSVPCASNAPEYIRLSNIFGCSSMTQRCCVQGGIPGAQPSTDRATCGKRSLSVQSRIFNGVPSGPCDWPFVVSIRSQLKNQNRLDYASTSHLCAGSIIDKNWVLTSATCVLGNSVSTAPSRLLVVAGEYNISGIDKDPLTQRQQEQIINVRRAIINPKYDFSSDSQVPFMDPARYNANNIALIQLATPINGKCSGMICLPTEQEASDDCASYEDCVIVGWGFTSSSFNPPKGSHDRLKQGRVKLASRKGCDVVVSRSQTFAKTRPAGSICQMPADNFLTDECTGDGGGPVMCSNGKNWVVRGVIPLQWCNDDKFNLFVTEVAPYLNWIKTTMAQFG